MIATQSRNSVSPIVTFLERFQRHRVAAAVLFLAVLPVVIGSIAIYSAVGQYLDGKQADRRAKIALQQNVRQQAILRMLCDQNYQLVLFIDVVSSDLPPRNKPQAVALRSAFLDNVTQEWSPCVTR